MKTFEIVSLSEIKKAAKWISNNIGNNKIVAFYGDMGAGKTTLIKSLCAEIGCVSVVTSPTFAIINEYKTKSDLLIYHFDFYRVKLLKEIVDLGFDDYIFSNNYCFIEWPEIVCDLLPQNFVKIFIKINENQKRILTLHV